MIAGLNLLRYVDGESIVHRADARTKVAGLTVLVFGLSFDPSWSSVGIIWISVAVSFLLARLPLGARPRLPRFLLWSMGIALMIGLAAGGEPFLDLGSGIPSIGVGGLLLQLRFFGVTLGLLALALMLGWTTPMADLPAAADWLLTPLRWLRIPIDDVVSALAIAVRALPLMAEELATTSALWRLRPSRQSGAWRGADVATRSSNGIVEMVDFAATATSSAVRRATEFADTLTNRGSMVLPRTRPSWSLADLWVIAITAATLAAIVLT